jgi:exodeoxyribonuclease VII small subunit
MPKTTKQTVTLTYRQASDELAAVLEALQRPDIQVDEAVQLYEKGLELADALEKHLQEAENTITKLQLQYDKAV